MLYRFRVGTEEAVLAWGSTLAAFESSENQDAIRQFMDFFAAPERQFQRASDWAWSRPGKLLPRWTVSWKKMCWRSLQSKSNS